MNYLLRILPVVLLASCSGLVDLESEGGEWNFDSGTDPVSRRPYAQASLRSVSMQLFVRCREQRFQVYVDVGFITQSGSVRYRIDNRNQVLANWNESTDFNALFYPGDGRAFARDLATAKEMIFEAREFGGPTKIETFRIGGLSAHLPRVEAACV